MICNCISEIEREMIKKYGGNQSVTVSFMDLLLFQGTLSNVVEISILRGDKKPKKIKTIIAHSYCPFCGIKYEEKEKLESEK